MTVSVRSSSVEAPPPPPTHVPLIEKHPAARLMPLAAVEVPVPVILSAAVLIPAVNVEDALPLTLRLRTERSPKSVEVALVKLATPWMEKSVPGVVVPMPTLPSYVTAKCVVVAVAVEEAITNAIWLVSPLLRLIESLPHGVEVPSPRLPAAVKTDERLPEVL